MLKLIFAFDQSNYTRYNSPQHVFLSNLSKDNPQPFDDFIKYKFGATYTVKLLVKSMKT